MTGIKKGDLLGSAASILDHLFFKLSTKRPAAFQVFQCRSVGCFSQPEKGSDLVCSWSMNVVFWKQCLSNTKTCLAKLTN